MWSTLIFPTITTAIFFLSSLEGPFDDGSGTLSSFGFNYGSLLFIQARSIFGIWILVFIHSWLFSIANYFWENQFKWLKIKNVAIIYSSIVLLIFLFGLVKTSSSLSSKSDTVKIAAVVLIPENGEAIPMSRIEGLTKRAVEDGAEIVSFQEYAMVIKQKDESRLREEYKRIAKENKIYLSITYAYFSVGEKGENKHLFINGKGEILLDYTKRYLTSTIENGFSFVRPTYNGYSYAADYHGKELAHMESDRTKEGIMYSDIPVMGIKVLYPILGDLLGWLSVITMFVLIGLAFFKKTLVDSDK